jgi:hypothetical protein
MKTLLLLGTLICLLMAITGCSKPEEPAPTPQAATQTGAPSGSEGQMKPAANTLPPPPGFTPK